MNPGLGIFKPRWKQFIDFYKWRRSYQAQFGIALRLFPPSLSLSVCLCLSLSLYIYMYIYIYTELVCMCI